MWDVDLMAATRAIEKTMPVLVYRLLVSVGLALGLMIAVAVGAGTGFAFGSFSSNPGIPASMGALLGLLGYAVLLHRLRGSWLHAVRLRQLAAFLAERAGTELPAGRAQVDFVKQQVDARFPSSTELTVLAQDVRQTLRAIPHCVWDTTQCLPVKQPRAVQMIDALLGQIAASAGDVLLAVVLREHAQDARPVAVSAVTAAASHWPALFRNLVWMQGFSAIGWLLALALIYPPFSNAAAALPVSLGVWPLVFAAAMAWGVKGAFFDPIAEAALLAYFLDHIQTQAPDHGRIGRLVAEASYQRLRDGATA